MSTLDRPQLVPFEVTLAEGHLPRPSETPATRGESPGLALGAARVPGSPSFPDPGAPAFALAWNQLALGQPAAPGPGVGADGGIPNAAHPPAGGAAPTTAGANPANAPVQPSGSVADVAGPAAGTGAPVNPFAVPLDFGALDALEGDALPGAPSPVSPPTPAGTPALSVVPASPSPEVTDLPTTSPIDVAPYWLAAVPSEGASNGRSSAGSTPLHIQTFDLDSEAVPALRSSGLGFDPHLVRQEFPILNERVNGKRLVWLDNAATTQKPRAVIDRVSYFYEHENSNIHRAAHTLAARATDAYENARESVRRFIGAPSKNDIVFVRGATEGINLVAQAWGRQNVHEGDEILLTHLEHHANIVPWQQLARETGAKLRVAPVDAEGGILLEEYERLLSDKTRIVAFTQVSNALGVITPAAEMIALAHRHGARVLLDGAQGVSHMPVDVSQLDCDFYVFSGHKVFAPTGIGVVYGKKDVLEAMPPWQGGGNMIQDVTFERTVYQGPPARFEAGTGNIADAVGLGAALDWLSRLGIHNVAQHEHDLLTYATDRLLTVPGLRLFGTAPNKAGVLSFVLAGQKTEEVGGLLDQEGIAVRSGHHCAQPILRRLGVEATVRASLAPYNTIEDIDALVSALHRLQAAHPA